MICSVAVSFAVRLVVLAVVGDQIVERKPVVAGHEIDALLGFTLFSLVNVRAPRQPERQGTDGSIIPFEEGPDIVAKPPVPFLPAVADKTADLVEAGRVPGLGDQLDIGEDRVGFDVPKDRRRCHRAAFLVARQDRGEIEAKAVDMHLANPIAQAVEN